jgi:hypothetical protein
MTPEQPPARKRPDWRDPLTGRFRRKGDMPTLAEFAGGLPQDVNQVTPAIQLTPRLARQFNEDAPEVPFSHSISFPPPARPSQARSRRRRIR